MKLKPLGDKLLVKRVKSETKTPGGLFIPDAAQEKANRGKVIAAGPGTKHPMEVKAGDIVVFGKYSSTELEFEGEKLLMLDRDEVQAIIEE